MRSCIKWLQHYKVENHCSRPRSQSSQDQFLTLLSLLSLCMEQRVLCRLAWINVFDSLSLRFSGDRKTGHLEVRLSFLSLLLWQSVWHTPFFLRLFVEQAVTDSPKIPTSVCGDISDSPFKCWLDTLRSVPWSSGHKDPVPDSGIEWSLLLSPIHNSANCYAATFPVQLHSTS